jgi:hypothetical protein
MDEVERMHKEEVITYFDLLSRYFLLLIEESYETHQSVVGLTVENSTNSLQD